MSSAAVGTHSGAGPLSLMSCVRESSPLQDFESDNEKNVASKRRFWNPKKWFKRKTKVTEDVVAVEVTEIGKDALRSRSTSELSVAEEGRRRSSSSMQPGLSVSHDSVFHSPNSGSDMELDAAQSSSSLSFSQPNADLRLQTELSERLRLRRGREDTSEDDEGLPQSPCNSPITSDGLLLLDKTAIKDLPTKSHSTCSDGSLLSMGSYELDEESFGPHSRHSSKISLHEKSSTTDLDSEFGPSSTIAPLNHSAAHHRASIKPKKTHGAPRRKRGQQLSTALPATPEVNEDSSIRSVSPEICKKESLTELYSMNTTRILTEIQIKCSSLPPGLTAPGSESSKLHRSKSNAGSKSQDHFTPLHEDSEKEEKLSLFERLFPRKSGKKKKLKEQKEAAKQEIVKREEESVEIPNKESRIDSMGSVTKSCTESVAVCKSKTGKNEASKPIPTPRSAAASRQRIQPIEIPASPEAIHRDSSILPKTSPEKSFAATSPLQMELENHFKQKQMPSSTSPTSVSISVEVPSSPKSPTAFNISKQPQSPILPTVIPSKCEYTQYIKSSSNISKCVETKSRSEDLRSKMKIPGLSSLQQRVLTLNNDDTDNSVKSLIEFQNESTFSKPVTKSHSFKSTKKQSLNSQSDVNCIKTATTEFLNNEKKETRTSFTRAASLDSVKNMEEQIHLSEMKFEFSSYKPDIQRNKNKKDTVENEKVTTEKSCDIFSEYNDSTITISGPSHTAIVNVTSNKEDFTSTSENQMSETIESSAVDGSHTISIKEHQVLVTKIQLKHETTQVVQSTVTVPKSAIPEFLNKQLNKVEARPTSNLIFSMKSPKINEEQGRPKTVFAFDGDTDIVTKPPAPRKFSKENLEIIEKDEREDEMVSKATSLVTVTSSVPQSLRFKKNENKSFSRNSSIISITPESPTKERPIFTSRSVSLDSLKTDINESDKSSSQDSIDKLDEKLKDKGSPVTGAVVLRRKSIVAKKNAEEPELMKVFARRSLKLKDSDVESIQETLADIKTRDSDKENQIDSPVDDCKKWFGKSTETAVETEFPQRRKSSVKEAKKEEISEFMSPGKEPLTESKIPDVAKKNTKDASDESPVALRKTINNNIFLGQRATSINPTKTISTELIMKKQSSFSERRKTDQWMANLKNEEKLNERIVEDNIISTMLPKGEFITQPKNFSQRKAEWEKRAQLAQTKKIP